MLSSRRKFLHTVLATSSLLSLSRLRASTLPEINSIHTHSNFRYIYGNLSYQAEFYDFLLNVFHLYPEKEIHPLIADISSMFETDELIYRELQNSISNITPFLSNLRYALPALSKQKAIMAEQTQRLLGDNKRYEGYLEIGTIGRYVDSLEHVLNLDGEKYFINERAPEYSLLDMIDRGQISLAGQHIEFNNYKADISGVIPNQSLDLVTVYIGFHHCPLNLRETFITSIRDAMKPDARLILRDHDAKNEKMMNMVALAHDVFNMGTHESWGYNRNELRHFYSLEYLNDMLIRYGFKTDGRKLRQKGDPTLNTLMLYKKA